MSVKCTALTLKGSPCTRNSKDGQFCGMHMKPFEPSMLLSFEHQDFFTVNDLLAYKKQFELKYVCELINLNDSLPFYDDRRTEEACLLIVKDFHKENIPDLPWCKKTILRKKLVNRRDKYILDFGENDINDVEYIDKMVNINSVPILLSLKAKVNDLIKYDYQKINGQYFFNKEAHYKYHGDLNNHIDVNFGSTHLYYQWYYNKKSVSLPVEIELNNDLLLMSEKALGKDAKQKGIPVLKYAIGDKFKK